VHEVLGVSVFSFYFISFFALLRARACVVFGSGSVSAAYSLIGQTISLLMKRMMSGVTSAYFPLPCGERDFCFGLCGVKAER
jgi:hypothetical protein